MLMLKVENLSKIYRYETPGFVTETVREAITNGIGKVLGREKKLGNQQFYALRDINFSVTQGESVGIIGTNGSGKTTLLKILSRITFPSQGEVLIYGRIGALLEVGGGFNQDLTGRENIFLVGSMLGMSISEVRQKFDQIVEFAGLEQFLETQVKHYSSGMQVRLSFSIAAHFEPEILLLDEILAVGDAEFQIRCLDKITELKQKGATLLFVTHDLKRLREVCQRTIWLEKGIQKMDGDTLEVENEYLKATGLELTPDEI